MPFTAEVSLELEVSPTVAFDTLADHDSWPLWMPPSFRPVGPSVGVLRVGRKAKVRIDRLPLPSTIHFSVVDRAREIAWCGGVRGVLWAEHAFLFEPSGGGTTVRSVETWSGALAGILRPALQRAAQRVGRDQLAGLRQGALTRARAEAAA